MTRILWALFTFQFLFTSAVADPDPIESLVEQEKTQSEQWEDPGEEEELPPMVFLGDQDAAEIYSSVLSSYKSSLACETIALDELMELSRMDPNEREVKLSLGIPRVREAIANNCLLRPTDELIAVGSGWNVRVTIKDFIAKKDRPVCPEDQAFSLWVTFENEPPGKPFLYATPVEMREGDNQFLSVDDLVRTTADVDERSRLRQEIKFLEDYEVFVYAVGRVNCDRLYVLKRLVVTADDEGLPNEMIYWESKDQLQRLSEERVDLKKGSGHLFLDGILDYNGDGFIDVIAHGDQYGCAYRRLFVGLEQGFSAFPLPNKPCSC